MAKMKKPKRVPDFKPELAKKVCSVEGCDRPVKARGLCNMHYLREMRAKRRAEEEAEAARQAQEQLAEQRKPRPNKLTQAQIAQLREEALALGRERRERVEAQRRRARLARIYAVAAVVAAFMVFLAILAVL